MNEIHDAASKASARRIALGAAFIVLLTFGVYWPVLRGGFVWDDLLMVQKNPLVTGEGRWYSLWFQADFPLTTVALWLQHLFWAENATGYHIVNVALHTLNALLVWRVLAALKIPGAWIGATLFAVHPVGVASAAWISELKNTLSLFFFLLSLCLWLRQEDRRVRSPVSGVSSEAGSTNLTPRPSHVTLLYWLSLGAFVLSLLSKTSTVMLPVVLLACVWWRQGGLTRSDLWRTVPFFALSLGFGLATVWIQKHQIIGGEIVQTEGVFDRLAGAGMALWFYVGKAFWPGSLSIIYPRWQINAVSWRNWLPLLFWILLLAAGWRFRQGRGRPLLFALGCFTVTLFPVMGFFDMYYMAFSRVSDHFQYLPFICLAALAGATLRRWLPGSIGCGAAAVLIAGLSVLTCQRARVFSTDERLWADTLAKNPAAWNAHNNLGCIRAEQGRLNEALGHFQDSLKFNPRNVKAVVNLAKTRMALGDFNEAEKNFQTALAMKADDPEVRTHYGSMLARLRRFDEAAVQLHEAIRLRPDTARRLELVNVYRAAGRTREAIAQCREALAANPDQPEVLSNLAWMLATTPDDQLRDGPEAVRCAQKACGLTHFKDAQKVGVLAAAYAEAGQFDKATATAEQAVALARAAGNDRFAAMNQHLLQLYTAGRPFHEPVPGARASSPAATPRSP